MLKGILNTIYRLPDGTTDYNLMKQHGFDTVDFQDLCEPFYPLHNMDESQMTQQLNRELDSARNAGMKIFQIHCCEPIYDSDSPYAVSNMDDIKRCVRGASILQSKYMAVHPVMPFGWGAEADADVVYAKNTAFYTELCTYAKNYGVDICLENMPFKDHFISRIPDVTSFIDTLGFDNLFVCLDTGHCNVFGDDCGQMIKHCADKLKILHVHDNSGRDDEHRFPYQGNINWQSFGDALRQISFEGSVSLEYKISKFCPAPTKELMQILSAKLADSVSGNV